MNQPVVLITGASSGIGKVAAALFAAKGYITYGTARRSDAFPTLQQAGVQPLCVDVTDERSMIEAVRAIEAKHGAVDILVNNAGYGQMGPLEELALNDVRRQFETNVFGLLRMSQLVLPAMRARGHGRIINISSMGGEVTFPGAGAYHMSKYAVEALCDALRYGVKSFGVNVISIQPGGVATNFVSVSEQTFHDGADAASPYAKFRAHTIAGMRRMFESDSAFGILTPEQVAATILRAAQARRPRARYKVGVLAQSITRARSLMPDRIWDSMMGSLFAMD